MRRLKVGQYVVDRPLLDVINDVRGQLTNGKLSTVEKKGDWIRVTCPSHSGGMEKNPSCGVYVGDDPDREYGYAHCFTCGFAKDFVGFVAECFESSYADAKRWLIANYGVRQSEVTLELEPIVLNKAKPKAKALDESILDGFQSWHPYMEKRHISREVAKRFKLRYDPKSECIVFPVYDESGRLVMLTRRSVVNKAFIIDKDKEKPVYLMDDVRRNGLTEATLVESQINALTLESWGIPAIATFGCNVTPKQMDIINRSGLTHLYICYDGDEAGRKGTRKVLSLLDDGIIADVVVMDRGKDVNDITEERYKSLPVLNKHDWMKGDSNGQQIPH